MHHFTQIPIQWSPDKTCQLPGDIALIPSGRIKLEEKHMISHYDSFLFATQSDSSNTHEAILKSWVPFHAFIFDQPSLYSDFELEKFSDHKSVIDIGAIPKMPTDNVCSIDYEDIAKQVYFLHEPIIKISYKELFDKYKKVEVSDINLLYLWLFPFDRGIQVSNYQIADSSYLKVLNLVTILDALMPPAATCGEKIKCPKCAKDFSGHRCLTENDRRKNFLQSLKVPDNVKDTYAKIINAAFDKIRHKAVHEALFPTASRVMQQSAHEVYDADRATQEFKEDNIALMGLVISLKEIVRYLLLHKLFNLSFFPELKPLQSSRITLG